ncbi:MAG: hypothetical protein KC657_19155 [Myxococcales bacterium]|nr:hypothetical protein [Myxococcales bacterium]
MTEGTGRRLARVIAAAVLLMHLAIGLAALALLPRGFSLPDLHVWSNTVIPAGCSLLAIGAVARSFMKREIATSVTVLVAAAGGGWLAAGAVGRQLFPLSIPLSRGAVPLAVGLALVALAWWARHNVAASIVGFLVGAGLGAVLLFAQRAPPPSTRPAGGELADVKGKEVDDQPALGQVVVPCGKQSMRVNPLLTFESRSPDGTWTLLAPPGTNGARRALTRYAKHKDGFGARYSDDGESSLVVKRKGDAVDIDAVSTLDAPVYSHLNQFTTLHIPFTAAVSFEPTGKEAFLIDVTDEAAPAQLAYMGPDLALHVVRASHEEKGPFTELARGPLRREAPFTLRIHPLEGDGAGCKLTFVDWTAQLSTEPSPTAGWGLPQSSVQFFARGHEAYVILTLADTGPGRGWDSVGHAAGTYRNRIKIEPSAR